MRILYVSQYFPPEVATPAVRVSELTQRWAEWGHTVKVLTGFPNHPEGVIHPEYRRAWRKGIYREDFHAVKVTRAWLIPARNRGYVGRGLNYSSFALAASLIGSWVAKPVDVVIATSPQLLVGVAGYRIARALGVPFVFEVRDLWPQSLVAVKASSNRSLLYRSLDRIARFLYQRATHIVVTTARQREAVAAYGIPLEKISVVRNGVEESFLPSPAEAEKLRADFGCSDKFVALFAGTLGMAHGIETLLEAARRLAAYPEIAFWLVGEGAEREGVLRRMEEMRLSNVKWFGRQPRSRMPAFLTAANVCLVTLRREKIFETSVPAKIFEAMAMSKPVILGVEGEAKEILLEARAGLAVTPEDPAALAEAIIKLWRNPRLGIELGESGRRAVLQKYSRKKLAAEYLELLSRLVGESGHAVAERESTLATSEELTPRVP